MLEEPFYELYGQIAIDLPGARGLFTTVSWGDVRDTHVQISQRLGVQAVHARQVHGIEVQELDAVPGHGVRAEDADALVTATAGLAPMVVSADCLPILLAAAPADASAGGGRAVGAVHAGWRGLRDGVIGQAVTRLRALAPGAALSAAIGPAAGVCCYEVGEELHELFAARGQDFRDGQNLDLEAIARGQLRGAGLGEIHGCAICTICGDGERLYSYRRDGALTGRQGAIVWLS